jgi:glutaredoxin
MTLLTKPGCPHCPPRLIDQVRNAGGAVYEVVRHPDGTIYVKLGEQKFAPLPTGVPAFPALLLDKQAYIGGTAIQAYFDGRDPRDLKPFLFNHEGEIHG